MIYLQPVDRHYCCRAFNLCGGNGSVIMMSKTFRDDKTRNKKMKELSKKFNIPVKVDG